MKKIPLLTSEDIEVKVKQVTKTGALLLLYKNSRTDRRILDEIAGPMNWTSDYKVVKDNLYCGIGIRDNENSDFVWKWDCGIESAGDDGNEKKAEASDAFKRAGFQWGIGAELYSTPKIWADVATEQGSNDKWFLKDRYASYVVTHIKFNEETRVITELEISNEKTGVVVYDYVMPTTGAKAKKMDRTLAKNAQVETEKPASIDVVEKTTQTLQTLIKGIGLMVKNMMSKDGNKNVYDRIVSEVTGDISFKCNTATEADYDIVYKIYTKLVEAGYKAN